MALPEKRTVAIIGGGIAGATAAQTLAKHDGATIHVFDQGGRGVGGRASSRWVATTRDSDKGPPAAPLRFDHGCQFLRADTPPFRDIAREWIDKGIVREWEGDFRSSAALSPAREFFGLPSAPPFYVGRDGMQSIARGVLEDVAQRLEGSPSSSTLRVFTGTRVAKIERNEDQKRPRWKLYGTSGTAAYHDTPEKVVQRLKIDKGGDGGMTLLGEESGYDCIIFTDVSSSTFGAWHRASAGVPEEFAARVRDRVGARVPLFTAMVAFDAGEANIPFDAASFDDPTVWFAARSNAKPGMNNEEKECWTIVSTPEYAMAKIEETPMQDPKTGEFIPQSKEYLTSVPGPDLWNAFKALLRDKDGILGREGVDILEAIHIDAQRWGSALPSHRRPSAASATRKVLAGVPYDSGRFALAPTKMDGRSAKAGVEEDGQSSVSFLVDEGLMLYQAGDMMSDYTPGFEAAALSGHDAATHLYNTQWIGQQIV